MRRATNESSGKSSGTQSFQSTLSMRRATEIQGEKTVKNGISIHALHEESDHCTHPHQCPRSEFQSTLSMRRATFPSFFGREVTKFQSTLSMRRATWITGTRLEMMHISIHALHEESDLDLRQIGGLHGRFQSTLSMRRATRISAVSSRPQRNFNPRSP